MVQKYPQWNVVVGYDEYPELGKVPRYHMDHVELFRECEELQRCDLWAQQARQQMFVAAEKAAVKAAKPAEYSAKKVALTVCPANGTPEMCMSIIEIVRSCKWLLSGSTAVVEQRSKPGEEPHGWHLHFTIKTTYAPTKIRQFVQQKLASRDYVATYYATPANAGWEQRYMRGVKGTPEKDLKVAQDRILRPKYGIPDVVEL